MFKFEGGVLMNTGASPSEYDKSCYGGHTSTLCGGCGHNSISNAIRIAAFELQIPPWGVVKFSGIGCSSKTPAYFLYQSHGVNSVHGRMPSVATGAQVVRPSLRAVGVSGDGDTASIGMGQFLHVCRRNLDLLYIIENNGTYGLTKGQFSATSDKGSRIKKSDPNPFPAMDLPILAINAGATFVARAFSGDRKQLVPLIKAGLSHKGIAVIDVISPCVTFNDSPDSTKGYKKMKDDRIALHELGFYPNAKEIQIEQEAGVDLTVDLHDGGVITLHKLDGSFDPTDPLNATKLIREEKKSGKIHTGLLYLSSGEPDLCEILSLPDYDLADLSEKELRPSQKVLDDLFNR